MRRIGKACAAAVLAMCPAGAGALRAQTAPVILTLPASTRALSMAGAYPISSVDTDIVFYNPALVRNASGISLAHQRYGNESTLSSLSASAAGIAFGVRVLDYGVSSAVGRAGTLLELTLPSSSDAGEVEAVAGYARTVKGLRLGIAGKWVQHWSGGSSAGVSAIDAGITASPIGWIEMALAVQNLGGDFTIDGVHYDLPRRAQFIATTDSKEIGPLDVMLAGQVNATWHDDVNGGLGLQAGYWPFNGLNFYARGGVRIGTQSLVPAGRTEAIQQGAITAGLGIRYKRVTGEWAWDGLSGTADGHRFGIRLN